MVFNYIFIKAIYYENKFKIQLYTNNPEMDPFVVWYERGIEIGLNAKSSGIIRGAGTLFQFDSGQKY